MEEKKTKRKLTTILSVDVKGYSHLMQEGKGDRQIIVLIIEA